MIIAWNIADRRLFRKVIGIALLLVWMGAMARPAAADLIIFYNGDFKYGQVKDIGNEYSLTINNVIKIYKKSQVREVAYGVNAPAPGEIVSVTDFIHAATDSIWQITGAITLRSPLQGENNRQVLLDVEEGFTIQQIYIFPTTYSFFDFRGSFLAAAIVNSTTKAQNDLEFRVYFYGDKDQLISSKDFYVNRLPPQVGNRPVGRRFALTMPDVPFDSIRRVRIVRKF